LWGGVRNVEETAGFQREGDAVVGGLEGTGPVRLGSDFKSSGGERIGADAGELEISKNVGGIVVVAKLGAANGDEKSVDYKSKSKSDHDERGTRVGMKRGANGRQGTEDCEIAVRDQEGMAGRRKKV
jgi:hypothetical protein